MKQESIKTPHSTNVKEITYIGEENKMVVTFKGDQQYSYSPVFYHQWEQVCIINSYGDSIGPWVNKNLVKNKELTVKKLDDGKQ